MQRELNPGEEGKKKHCVMRMNCLDLVLQAELDSIAMKL